MSRPLRIERPGALYHVMARGHRRRPLFLNVDDYRQFLSKLGDSCERFNFLIHAYCLMPNHYHLMVETIDGALGRGIGHLNATYSQFFNRHYAQVGHVFQGRYKAILVQKESYLLELSRYLILNPVRAGLTEHPGEWNWSSYHYTMGRSGCPRWLHRDWLLSQFGVHESQFVHAFRQFVDEGRGKKNPLLATRHQLILGDDHFTQESRGNLGKSSFNSVPRVQRRLHVGSLQDFENQFASRDEAIGRAYHSTAFTMAEIGEHFGILPGSVSRAIKRFEKQQLPAANAE